MPLLETLRRHPVWSGVAAGLVIGGLVGLFLPIRAPSPAVTKDASWQLPTLASARPYTDSAAQSVRGASFWGADAGAAERRARPADTWQLRAILTRPSARIAITQVGKESTLWVPLRGRLPDGSVLVAVDRDAAYIERDGCRSARKLYPIAGDAQNDPCATPAAGQPRAQPAAAAPGSPNPQKKNAP